MPETPHPTSPLWAWVGAIAKLDKFFPLRGGFGGCLQKFGKGGCKPHFVT